MAVKPLKINIKYPTPTAAERLHQRQQELRKKAGLPDPSEYKKRAAEKQKEIDAMKNEEVEQLDEMPESSMKTKDVHAHLKKHGWTLARSSGGHDIYKHPKSPKHIAVPRHGQLKAPLIKGILKSSKVNEDVEELDEQLYKKARFVSGPSKRPFKSNTVVSPQNEAVSGNMRTRRQSSMRTGVMTGGGDDTLENIPYTPKTDKEKRIKAALDAFGEKMKAQNPKLREESEYLEEKNSPTNPSLWSKAKSLARSKFDVYPSAYANGWAAKWYKSKGGGWKSVSESTEDSIESHSTLSRKAQIVKDAAKGKKYRQNAKDEASDKFQSEPELSSAIHKT